MKRFLIVLVVAIAAAVVVPLSVAQPPLTVTFELEDIAFPDAFLTDACGVDVEVSITGTLNVALFLGKDGLATHEVDTFRGTLTYSAGSNALTVEGSSVSRASYPEGASEGAPAVVAVTGLNGGTLAGGPPGRGQLTFDAEVLFVDPDGFPITVPVGDFDLSGNFEQATAAICEALT